MKPLCLLLALALTLPLALAIPGSAAGLTGQVRNPGTQLPPELQLDPAFLDGLAEFSGRFLKLSLEGGDQNTACSPVSLSVALSLAAVGAQGETQQELLTAMGLTGRDAAWLAQQNQALLHQLTVTPAEGAPKDAPIALLQLANSLWLQKGVPFYQAYLDTATGRFNAAGFSVDFNNPETGRQVSAWIHEQTKGLLSPQIELDRSTILALVNTIYLKDNWSSPFMPQATQPDTFHAATGDVTADFMEKTQRLSFHQGNGYTAVSVPMRQLGSMTFVLPDEAFSVDRLLQSAKSPQALFDLSQADMAKVRLRLPKFDVKGEPPLLKILGQLGISKALDPTQADFGALSSQSSYIGDARQQARVKIDESGVEAAAFTLIANRATGAVPQFETVYELTLDRPFLFGITSTDGVLLFAGAVRNPTL